VVFRLGFLGSGFWLGLPVSVRGRTEARESAEADYVFKGSREPQPARERVDGLAVQEPPARRVGALLELESDTHRLGLVHTAQPRSRCRGSRHGVTVVLAAPAGAAPGGAAPGGAAERSAAGSWPREPMESFW
jgi:hypothetical protein